MKQNNVLIGITGQIGSGKTTVMNHLRTKNFSVLFADEQTNYSYNFAKPQLVESFSDKIIDSNGNIDKVILGNIIFSSFEKRQELNRILHPIIIDLLFEKASKLNGIVFIEIPLLLQCNLQSRFFEVWIVKASDETKLERIQLRDKITYENAFKRLETQNDFDELKMNFPHIIIPNNGDIKNLENAVDVEIAKLENRLEK